MPRSHRSRSAEFDLLDIWSYIARHDVSAADRLLEKIDEKIEFLAEHPHLGESVDSISPGLRAAPIGSYVIYFTRDEDGIVVVRVLHGARDRDAAF